MKVAETTFDHFVQRTRNSKESKKKKQHSKMAPEFAHSRVRFRIYICRKA